MINRLVFLGLCTSLTALAAPSKRATHLECFRVTYSDWTTGGEGREFYAPLPAIIELRDEKVSTDSDARIGYRVPLGP
jgi:hypothetical protein